MSNVQVSTVIERKGLKAQAVITPLGAGYAIRVGGKYIATLLSVDEALKGLHSGRFDRRIFR
jgi:hypothetical protein